MPRSKIQSPSDDSLVEGREVRRRVVKACQRCRLKKCKCDGANPCTRCKTDDAICAYGKHRKSDKTVFRRGYVQMLERQHSELIAGLQELYRRIQAGEPFPSPRLEPAYNGQPLTHKILEALGVLPSEEWEDNDKTVPFDGMTWQGLEQDGYAYDVSTATTSPIAQTPFSPISMTPFPQSTIMAKRARKLQDSACIVNDNDVNNNDNNNNNHNNNHNHKKFGGKNAVLCLPPTLNTNVPPSTYQNHDISSASFHGMQHQQPQQPHSHQQQPLPYHNNGPDSTNYESMDWIFGCNEDLFNDTQGLVAQLA